MRTTAGRTLRKPALAFIASGAALLAGCGGTTIGGKVLRGEIGRAIIVTDSDPRLADPGLAGIEVEISTPVSGRGGRAVLGTGITDDTGAFKINAGPSKNVPPRVAIRASAPDEYEVRQSIFRPRAGEKVLLLMRPPKAP
ncbi:MAG: hypothetical protein ACIARR_05070 [Phycisphaerales bacterium JB059]